MLKLKSDTSLKLKSDTSLKLKSDTSLKLELAFTNLLKRNN